jgi:hypothetical protein
MLAVIALSLGCGSSKNKTLAADSDSPIPPVTDVVPPSRGAKNSSAACPATGAWALCSVERRLRRAGFVPRKLAKAATRRPGFSVEPTTYAVGRDTLEIFLYPDSASLARDWSKLDTIAGAPRGAPSSWPMPPTVLRSVNLAAVYLTDSQTQAERLTLALTAGAPQPAVRSMISSLLPAVEVGGTGPGGRPNSANGSRKKKRP